MSDVIDGFGRKDLLDIETLSKEEIDTILALAESFKEVSTRDIKKVPTLKGRTIINLFFEASTRTRVSFEIAEKRLSADSINITASASSAKKGETLLDTARNLMAMEPDIIVLRHHAAGAANLVAGAIEASVINAGDGCHEHPTQALLDLFTVKERCGGISGLNITIIGDITHSRVVRSNIHGFNRMGANVTVCGPPMLIPMGIEALGVRATNDLKCAVDSADVVMVLRIQLERQAQQQFPSLREYANQFGLNRRTIDWLPKKAVIMHPGPINRGVELASEIADGERSVILDQVTNGLAVRMAILYLLGTRAAKKT